jgi:hypothetical protein
MQSTCAILYCHLWPVRLYHIFPHYRINNMTFGKMLVNMKCVFWFSLQLLSENFLNLRRIQRGIFINVHRSSFKVPVIFVRFSSILSFHNRLLKNPRISDFMIIRPDTELFIQLDRRTDARTYITKLIAAVAILWTRVRSFAAMLWVHLVTTAKIELYCHLVAQLDTTTHCR